MWLEVYCQDSNIGISKILINFQNVTSIGIYGRDEGIMVQLTAHDQLYRIEGITMDEIVALLKSAKSHNNAILSVEVPSWSRVY